MKYIAILVLAALCSACVTTQSQNPFAGSNYSANQVGGMANVEAGVVEFVRPISITQQNNGGYVGASLGGLVGAAVGSKIGRGKGNTLATVLTGAAGAAVGNEIQNRPSMYDGVEVQVRLVSGRSIVVTQGNDERFQPGQRVRVIFGGTVRITGA